MGLAAPQRRNKISHDPNNTAWSKSTNTYGQKILSSQGWKPGDYLGAENASHGEHYTAANASHIRILLREENLGLGAQVGKSNAETFGLSLFSGVLGRLNGKSEEEVERQQGALRDAELRMYQSKKYGFMNFVSGGVLVGDIIEPMKSTANEVGDKRSRVVEVDGSKDEVKKRRQGDTARSKSTKDTKKVNDADELPAVEKDAQKRKQRIQRSSSEGIDSSEDYKLDRSKGQANSERDTDASIDNKKTHKKRKAAQYEETTAQDSTTSTKSERSRSKIERRARKEERRKRKEERKRAKLRRNDESAETSGNETSQIETTTNPALLLSQSNRHAVRRRYIEQKRMTSMNPQAMKEIFMLPTMA